MNQEKGGGVAVNVLFIAPSSSTTTTRTAAIPAETQTSCNKEGEMSKFGMKAM